MLLGAASAVTVAGLLASLPAANDTALPRGIDAPVKVPAACSVIEQAEQDEAAGSAGSSGTSPKQSIPPGYSIYAAMDSSNNGVGVGLIHPDGLVEMCEDRASRAELGVVYSRAADLGQLPEGVSYAYQMPDGRTADGRALKAVGVRLLDGTVVEELVLPDGRTVPTASTPATPR